VTAAALALQLRGDVVEDGTRYPAAALAERATDLAAIIGAHVPQGAVVAVAATSAADHLVSHVAARHVGRSVAHLSSRTPRRPRDIELFTQRRDSAAVGAVLADDAHATALAGLGYSSPVAIESSLTLWSEPGAAGSGRSSSIPEGATIIHTSGSTGPPKGVVIEASALTASLTANQRLYDWRSDDVFLNAMAPTHLAGLTNLLSAAASGVTTLMPPPFAFADAVANAIEEWKVTVMGLVPFQLHQLLRSDRLALQGLRLVVSSAAPLTPAVIARLGQVAPASRLVNAYGLSEAFRSLTADIEGANDANLLGWPGPNVHAELRDALSGATIDEGVGELYLRGPNVFAGYVGQHPHRGWVPTGDLARRTTKGYRLLGRRSNQINVGGEKVAAETIEEALGRLTSIPIAVAPQLGEDGNDRVIAVAERPPAESTLQLDQLTGTGELAPSLRPSALVMVECLPRTATGKIDRRALNQLVATTHPTH